MSKQLNVRLPDKASNQLEILQKDTGMTQVQIIIVALDRMYREEERTNRMSKVVLEQDGAIVVEDLEVQVESNESFSTVTYDQQVRTVDFDKVMKVWREPHISLEAVDKALNGEEA